MEQNHIRTVLTTTNLAPHLTIYQKVTDFLENQMGIHNKATEYQVLAAFAIISEVEKIKAVDNLDEVSTGIHIESVMKHLGKYSKELLLQEVVRQGEKWRGAPVWLRAKIDSVNIAYRIYKKYRAVFQDLAKKYSNLDEQSQYNLMSIFWVLYLFTKNSSRDMDVLEATKILESLFKFVFGELFTQMDSRLINEHFKNHFSNSEPLQCLTYETYKEKMLRKLEEVQQEERGEEAKLDLLELVTTEHVRVRFLDDMSNNYQKFKKILPPHHVDQILFLDLEKNLTPQPLKRAFNENHTISKKINFAQEDDQKSEGDDNDSKDENDDKDQSSKMEVQSANHIQNYRMVEERKQPIKRLSIPNRRIQPLSPFRPIPAPRDFDKGTPVSARNQNLAWVNKITQSNERQNYEQLKTIYQLYSGKNFEVYQSQAINKILAAIDNFTPSCMDIPKRQRSIFSFFAYFIKTVYNKHQQSQRQTIFSNDNYFNAILCLSTNLFNYAYQSLQSAYKLYCEIFGIGIIEGQIPINWFGFNAEMPKNIEIYLYDLQKKVLIQEIWEGDEGYSLLTQNANTYQGQAILKRIKRHADQRTQQLCQAMKIEYKQIGKIINLIRFILQKRQTLLKDHNIDQIIVCAITSIVSINRSQTMSLVETFEHYNKLLFSLNISRSIFYDREGNQIDIVSYYNDVFLPQVDEIIYNEEQAANILYTPVRLQLKSRVERGETTLPSLKFKQFSSESLGKNKIKTDSEDKYRNRQASYNSRLVNNVLKIDINEKAEQQIEEDVPSPSFGGTHRLYRCYSFGDIEDKL